MTEARGDDIGAKPFDQWLAAARPRAKTVARSSRHLRGSSRLVGLVHGHRPMDVLLWLDHAGRSGFRGLLRRNVRAGGWLDLSWHVWFSWLSFRRLLDRRLAAHAAAWSARLVAGLGAKTVELEWLRNRRPALPRTYSGRDRFGTGFRSPSRGARRQWDHACTLAVVRWSCCSAGIHPGRRARSCSSGGIVMQRLAARYRNPIVWGFFRRWLLALVHFSNGVSLAACNLLHHLRCHARPDNDRCNRVADGRSLPQRSGCMLRRT